MQLTEIGRTLIAMACAACAAPAEQAPRQATAYVQPARATEPPVRAAAPSNEDDDNDKCQRPWLAVALILDRTASMSGRPLEMAKAAATRAATLLDRHDYLEVIAFDANAVIVAQTGGVARPPAALAGNIAALATGSAAGELFLALDAAYQRLPMIAARRFALLLTDGSSSQSGLVDVVEAMAADRITLTTVALGAGTDAPLLARLAAVGGGRFHEVGDPADLPRIFADEIRLEAAAARAD